MEWAGSCIIWFIMETMVFFVYLNSMITLIIKSRFVKIGVDSTYQFEPPYLTLMVNKIISHLDLDMDMRKRTFEATKNYYVNKMRRIYVENVHIKIMLSEVAYEKIFEKRFLSESGDDVHYVTIDEAPQWFEDNIVGTITKHELDE